MLLFLTWLKQEAAGQPGSLIKEGHLLTGTGLGLFTRYCVRTGTGHVSSTGLCVKVTSKPWNERSLILSTELLLLFSSSSVEEKLESWT